MMPRQIFNDQTDALDGVITLIRDSFAYMDGVIAPPSSMHRLTFAHLQSQTSTAQIWVLGDPILACVILTPKNDTLYVGKLAVAAATRGRGLAGQLLAHAATVARQSDLTTLTLQTRIELTANHHYFMAQGFQETARTTHTGFDRPTSITFTKQT
jgi:ribosomal protein S18 acetylase RimI-like enzyme